MRNWRRFGGIGLFMLGVAAAAAQPEASLITPTPDIAAKQLPRPPGMPAEVASALHDIGRKVEGPKTAALYAPLHAGLNHDAVTVQRDLAYGSDERQRADVFVQQHAGRRARPLLIYVYGGGFAGGSKHAPNSPFYDNIGYWAAEHGMVGVTINYRLAPQFTWPAGADDVALAVAWAQAHAKQWGADPKRIFLWGHSSGGGHVAAYLARTPQTPVVGAVLMSGALSAVPTWKAYYGDDASLYAERSPLPHLVDVRIPLFVVWAELDPPDFVPETEKLVADRKAAGKPTRSLLLPNHSHLSEAYAVGTADESLTAPLAQFIRETK